MSLAQTLKPVKGGTLKGMRIIFPKNLGYVPEWAPADFISALPWTERLVHWDEKGGFVPILLESWKIDPNGKTITYISKTMGASCWLKCASCRRRR